MKRYERMPILQVVAASTLFFVTTIRTLLFAQEHTPDQYTLLLLHCNGDVNGAQGETPTQALGVTFEPGIFGDGAYFSPGNQVYFPSADNLSSTEGTLEFWIKPRWNGNDGQNRIVLRYGVDGGMLFFKDGGNYWRSIFNRYGSGVNPEIGTGINVSAEWSANLWHHCAFTWNGTVLNLYVDGVLRAARETSWPLDVVNEATFQLGAEFDYSDLDAVIDELRISDIERSAQEILASYLAGQADPFTVTNTNDSGPGSLRQAILNANATPGLDVVRFDIPGDGPHTIQPLSTLPFITDPVVIDGASQPGFSGKPIIELDGSMSGDGTNGLHITAGNSTVQGLVINRFSWSGILLALNGSNIIRGNYIGTDVTGTVALGNGDKGINVDLSSNNTIGGTNPVDRNIISGNQTGILIFGHEASGNKVLGNYIGTDVTGNISLFNFTGVWIWRSHNNLIGGTSAAARNVISGNKTGVGIQDGWENRVQGNYIGANANGAEALGNTDDGVDIACGYNNVVSDNVISANLSTGVVIRCSFATGNLVQRNLIGTDKSGKIPLGNGEHGVAIADNASNNTVGGTNRSEGNVIAFNSPSGVIVHSSIDNAILSNSIFSNSGLGIDLGSDGLTPNDEGDSDTGANNLQNFPILTVVNRGDGKKALRVALNSAPNTQFTLQFFANRACDPSNHGEGELFVISRKVTTSGSGDAVFQVAIPNFVPEGFLLTATATDPNGNTSEFSPCVEIAGASGTVVNPEDNLEKGDAGEAGSSVPDHFALLQNHPNPFNPETEIRFALPQASQVVVKIFNTLGEEVQTLVDERREAGYHRIFWDGKDKNGNPVASGIYLYHLRAGRFLQVKKMSLLR